MRYYKKILDSKYWNDVGRNYKGFYIEDEIAQYKSREFLRILTKWGVGLDENSLVTDLFDGAFGNKDYLEFLQSSTTRLYGIDISRIIAEKAKINKTGPSCYVVCDVKKLPFKDNTFGMVLSPSTLDHFSEIDEALKEINRILKKDGQLIILLNNKHNPFFIFNLFIYSLFNWLGFYVHKTYSFQETEKLLQTSGFCIEGKTTIMHIPFLFPTLCRIANKIDSAFLKKINLRLLAYCENYGKDMTSVRKRIGWWIALKARKL